MDIKKIIDQKNIKLSQTPKWGVILGSGVDVFNDIEVELTVSFKDIFGISPSVSGHSGSFSFGYLKNSSEFIVVQKGRYHPYEGHDISTVTLPISFLHNMGVENVIVTNAAGGIDTSFKPADLMVITGIFDCLTNTDVISVLKNVPTKYDTALLKKALMLSEQYSNIHKGSYAALLGPSYETTAEVFMLKKQKVNAVGMSTAPELRYCIQNNLNILALSVITNVWGSAAEMGGHTEVLEVSKIASKTLDKFLTQLILK